MTDAPDAADAAMNELDAAADGLLAFVTSGSLPSNLGGFEVADALCNELGPDRPMAGPVSAMRLLEPNEPQEWTNADDITCSGELHLCCFETVRASR